MAITGSFENQLCRPGGWKPANFDSHFTISTERRPVDILSGLGQAEAPAMK
jgi:hypothetical protein